MFQQRRKFIIRTNAHLKLKFIAYAPVQMDSLCAMRFIQYTNKHIKDNDEINTKCYTVNQ